MHRETDFNQDWLFCKGDLEEPFPYDKGVVYSESKTIKKLRGPAAYGYFDSPNSYYRTDEQPVRSIGWKRVDVPHDFIIDQTPREENNDCMGYFEYFNGWYRKHFTMPEGTQNKRVVLRFEGIAGKSTIYLNGCTLKYNYSRYNSFDVDISDYVFYHKENVLAVFVEAKSYDGWWYQGGGIYRNVKLLVTDRVAIDCDGVFAPATRLDDHEWRVDLETTVLNISDAAAGFELVTQVMDKDGNTVGTGQTQGKIAARAKDTFRYALLVKDPALWDTENPNLYSVVTRLFVNGEALDENRTRIGFRTIELDPEKGFLLNGKKTFIKGLCCHQDYGLTGIAVPDNVAKYKVQLFKEMGANGFRTSHYQYNTATMDALDELGFIVMNETRWFDTTETALAELTALVKRDRNRPSVVFWSTGNEEPYHITDNGTRIHKTLAAHIRSLDNTRFIMSAQSVFPERSTIFQDCDIIGMNYKLEFYEQIHQQYPDKLMFASECCATGTTRGWHLKPTHMGRIQEKDRDANFWFRGREKTWKFLTSKPYVIGGYQWAAVEHRGEAEWPALCSKSGAIDLFLQKKAAFYQNQSHWTEKPMVHIVPHWNFQGMEGHEIEVIVYTNCQELELFLNGVSLGRKQIEEYGQGNWNVAFAPGELKCVAYQDGKAAAEHIRQTTKAPARLVLRQELPMRANNYDVGIFTCQCVDEDGRVVENASPFVRFAVNEFAKIVGTGSDNCDHNKVTLPERRMYAGKIAIAVKASQGKQLHLYAQSDGLGMAELVTDYLPVEEE